MGNLLDGIFRGCYDFNDGIYEILNSREEIRKCDREIESLTRKFKDSIKDEELKNQIIGFCEALREEYTHRDCIMSKVLVTHGMALNIQLMTEILTSK